MNKKDLDLIALNIEYLLVSVVQGVALSSLASSSVPLLVVSEWQYWPAILSGFLLVLIFWSQSIIHSVSFIDWPIHISRSFLYFLASFVEVITFAHLHDPMTWYIGLFVFFSVVFLLYWVDMKMILQKKKNDTGGKRARIMAHMLTRQQREMRMILPLGLGYPLCCVILLFLGADVAIQEICSIGLLMILSIGLWKSVKSYTERMDMITEFVSSTS